MAIYESLRGHINTDESLRGQMNLPQQSGGTSDYNELTNKPQIEGVTLIGNKTYPELTLVALENIDIYNVINGTNILGD